MTAKDMKTTLIQKMRKTNIFPTRFIEPLLETFCEPAVPAKEVKKRGY